MGLKEDLQSEVKRVLASSWSERDGQVVPEADDLGLGNEAVKFDEAVVLYADLAESTQLVQSNSASFAAEIYKTYLHCASKIIRKNGGEITAFDGDRVMAVFLGYYKRTNAADAALKINYAVNEIIKPAAQKQYPNNSYVLRHAVGIDMSKLFIARTGVRGSNDLVWVGRSANFAAKLSALREGNYSSYITADVYDPMNETAKLGGNPKRNMWESRTWTAQGITIYRSNWQRSF